MLNCYYIRKQRDAIAVDLQAHKVSMGKIQSQLELTRCNSGFSSRPRYYHLIRLDSSSATAYLNGDYVKYIGHTGKI